MPLSSRDIVIRAQERARGGLNRFDLSLLEPALARRIEENLQVVRMANLYEFIGISSRSSNSELRAAVGKLRQKFIRVGAGDRETRAGTALAEDAERVFAFDDGKIRYDNARAFRELEIYREELERLQASGGLTDRNLEEVAAKGLARNLPPEVIEAFLQPFVRSRPPPNAVPQAPQADRARGLRRLAWIPLVLLVVAAVGFAASRVPGNNRQEPKPPVVVAGREDAGPPMRAEIDAGEGKVLPSWAYLPADRIDLPALRASKAWTTIIQQSGLSRDRLEEILASPTATLLYRREVEALASPLVRVLPSFDLVASPSRIRAGCRFRKRHDQLFTVAWNRYKVAPLELLGVLDVQMGFGEYGSKYFVVAYLLSQIEHLADAEERAFQEGEYEKPGAWSRSRNRARIQATIASAQARLAALLKYFKNRSEDVARAVGPAEFLFEQPLEARSGSSVDPDEGDWVDLTQAKYAVLVNAFLLAEQGYAKGRRRQALRTLLVDPKADGFIKRLADRFRCR